MGTQSDKIHHILAGEDSHSPTGSRFAEYRRKWKENPQNLDPGEFPLHLDIEVTSSCNLKCPFCATTHSKFKPGFIKWSMVKKIIDEGSEYGLYACKFNFRGEPLLHKELVKFVSYAKKNGVIDVFFNSNATLLSKEISRALIDAGLDRITISFEGHEKSIYEKNRVGASFNEVLENVDRLRNLRERLGSSVPKIRVQAVLTSEMASSLDEYVKFWKGRADQVSYNEMEPASESVFGELKPVAHDWICPFLYQRMTIMWDGTIIPCKNDYFGALELGSIHTDSIQQCWTNGMEKLRKMHCAGLAHELKACAVCPLRRLEIDRFKKTEPAKE